MPNRSRDRLQQPFHSTVIQQVLKIDGLDEEENGFGPFHLFVKNEEQTELLDLCCIPNEGE